MDLLMQDVRYAVRRLAASPLFALMAILIVGVGIAANTTVFSAVNAVLLRPLPFANADRVVHVYQDSDEGAPQSSSFPAYRATIRGVMMTVAVGLAAGLVLSIGAAQGLAKVLYRVPPTDPVTLVVVTLVLAFVALVAALVPARRATRVNPLVVLRYQ